MLSLYDPNYNRFEVDGDATSQRDTVVVETIDGLKIVRDTPDTPETYYNEAALLRAICIDVPDLEEFIPFDNPTDQLSYNLIDRLRNREMTGSGDVTRNDLSYEWMDDLPVSCTNEVMDLYCEVQFRKWYTQFWIDFEKTDIGIDHYEEFCKAAVFAGFRDRIERMDVDDIDDTWNSSFEFRNAQVLYEPRGSTSFWDCDEGYHYTDLIGDGDELDVFEAQMGGEICDITPKVDNTVSSSPLNEKKKLPRKFRGIPTDLHDKYSHKKLTFKKTKRIPEEFNAQMDYLKDFLSIRVKGDIKEEQFDVINNVADSLEKLVDIMSNVVDVNGLQTNSLASVATQVGRNASEGALEGMVDKLKSLLEGVALKLGLASITIVCSSLVVALLMKYGMSKRYIAMLAVFAGVCLFIGKSDMAEAVWSFIAYIKSKFVSEVVLENEEFVQAEDFVAQDVDAAMIVDIAGLILGYITMPSKVMSKDFARYVADLGRAIPAAENVVSLVIRVLQRVLDYGCRALGYESYQIVSTMMPKVDAWVKDAKNTLNKMSYNEMNHDQATHDHILSLEDRAYELLVMVSHDRKNPVIGPLIRPIVGALENIRKGLILEGVCESQTRQAPVVTVVSGESQIGKTFVERNFVASLIALTQSEEILERFRKNPEDFTYSRMVENEFWDGYHGQLVCVFDEKDLVHKDHLTSKNSDTEIIRSGNTFAYPLHMASIEQKANTFFRSKFIFCTTNVAHTTIAARHSVRYPDAVTNRIHFEISMRVKKEFACPESVEANPEDSTTWALNKEFLPEDGSFRHDMYDFVKYEMVRVPGTPNQRCYTDGKTYTYEELLVAHAKKYFALERAARQVPRNDQVAFEFGADLRRRHFAAEMDDADDERAPIIGEMEEFVIPTGEPHPWDMDFSRHEAFVDEGVEEYQSAMEAIEAFSEGRLSAKATAYKCAMVAHLMIGHVMMSTDFTDYRVAYVDSGVISKWAFNKFASQFGGMHDLIHELLEIPNHRDLSSFFQWYGFYVTEIAKTQSYYSWARDKLISYELGFAKALTAYNMWIKKISIAIFGRSSSLFTECLVSGVVGFTVSIPIQLCVQVICNVLELPYYLNIAIGKVAGYEVKKLKPVQPNATFVDCMIGAKRMTERARQAHYVKLGFPAPPPRENHVAQMEDTKTFVNWWSSIEHEWYVDYVKIAGEFTKSIIDTPRKLVYKLMDLVHKGDNEKIEVAAEMFDPGLEDVVMKIWKKNYYSIRCEKTGLHLGWGFFSHGTTFNFCVHYANVWKARDQGHEFVLLCRDGLVPIRVVKSRFFDFKRVGEDQGCIDIEYVANHADLRNLFADAKDLVTRPTGVLMIVKRKGDNVVNIFTRYALDFKTDYKDSTDKKYIHPMCIRYDVKTEAGDCGMPLFIVDPTTRNRKFIGFHVAGSGSFGLGAIFDGGERKVIAAQYCDAELPKSMKKIGEITRMLGTSGQSSIRRSALWGAWSKPVKRPSRLSPFINEEGERVFPMDRALKRFDRPIPEYDDDLVRVCAHDAVGANTTGFPFRELPKRVDIETAVAGIPGVEFMDAMNRSTSPGYPWNMNPRTGYKGKERFLGKNEDIDFSGPDWEALKNEVLEAEEMLERGERPTFYFADSLKDELIKETKYRSGDTRMFCASPMVYQVLFGMYFKEFLQKFMQNRITGEHIVGVNVYSDEWEMVRRELVVHGDSNIIAGDFKSFDASQSAQILKAIGDEVIESFEDREYDEIRRMLWMEVFNSRHVVGKDIIEWSMSLPSGHGATTAINCMFVSTIFRMCFLKLADKGLPYIREFKPLVKLKAYGDDQVVGIHKSIVSWFNQSTITGAMACFGMEYTPEDKDATVSDLRNIDEVQFISRSWRYEPLLGRHVAPLKLQTIIDMPQWTKKNGAELITISNLDNALRELSLHPTETFDEWAPAMLRAARQRLNYVPAIVDRNTLLFETVKKEINYSDRLGLYLSDPSKREITYKTSVIDRVEDREKNILETNNVPNSA